MSSRYPKELEKDGILILSDLLQRISTLYKEQVIQYLSKVQKECPKTILREAKRKWSIYVEKEFVSKKVSWLPILEDKPWIESFWVVISFLPESSNFYTMQYPFTFMFHARQKLIEVAYFPDGKEEVINTKIRNIPVDNKETIRRIAVLENPNGIYKINGTGFTHFCCVNRKRNGLEKIASISLEQAWKEEKMH